MVETIKMSWHIGEPTVQTQPCPICGEARQRIVHSSTRPDFVICDACHAAYVMEDGEQKRLLYGQIPALYAQARNFALKHWRTSPEIASYAERDRIAAGKSTPLVSIPVTVEMSPLPPVSEAATPAIQPSDDPQFLFRRLRETGELPNIDDLFEDKKPKLR